LRRCIVREHPPTPGGGWTSFTWPTPPSATRVPRPSICGHATARRQEILAEARRLGFSDFQAQLLIAQVQFGDDQIPLLSGGVVHARRGESPRTWARFAAAGVLALAMFLAMVRWLAP
jgi:hypothetical protein